MKSVMKKPYLKRRHIAENIEMYLMMAPVLILILIFSYIPLYGIIIAFQDYVPGVPFFGSGVRWVGLKHFQSFIGSFYFPRILRNTLILSALNLVMGFWVPIAFALLLNEMRLLRLKKFIQTASYMPYFVSMVVVAGMVLSFISSDGLIVRMADLVGLKLVSLNTKPGAFPWIYTLTNIWKGFGWSSILYLSTISSVDVELYEVAEIDGANRWQMALHITLPFLLPLIIIQLIFAIGGILGSNTELILLLYNPALYAKADVIGTYVYREGLLGGRFSYGTASGILLGVIGFILTFSANRLAARFTEYSLW